MDVRKRRSSGVSCFRSTKIYATEPTPVVVVKEKEHTTTTDIMVEVVTTLPNATREGASVGVVFKDNTVERQRRVVARRDGRTRQ